MAEKPKPNPEEKGKQGDENKPQTPEVPEQGTEGGDQPPTPKTPPTGAGLTPEEEEELKELREIKESTGFKKFSESAREAQRLSKEAKLKDERIKELEVKLKSEPPSDKELANKHPNWEFMEEEEKERIRREEAREKRLRKLEEQSAWEKDYKGVLKKFPDLAKKEEEFKDFAYKHPEIKDLEVLAKSFLFEAKPEEPEPDKPPKPGLEKPTGGTSTVPSTELTLEDITRLREDNPKKYFKMIQEGKIKEIPEK